MIPRWWQSIFEVLSEQYGREGAVSMNATMFAKWFATVILMLVFFTHRSKLRKEHSWLILPLGGILLCEHLVYVYFMKIADLMHYKILIFLVYFLALLLTVCLFFMGRLHDHLLKTIAGLVGAYLARMMTQTIIQWFAGYFLTESEITYAGIVWHCLWHLCTITLVIVLLRFYPDRAEMLPAKLWGVMLLFCLAFACDAFLEYFSVLQTEQFNNIDPIHEQWNQLQWILRAMNWSFNSIAICVICCVGFFIRLSVERSDRLEIKLRQQKIELEQMQRDYQAFSTLRHDYKNQLVCVQSLLRQNEPEKAADYLETLTERHFSDASEIRSSSKVINAVLHTKYNEASESGIPLSCRITTTLPEPLEYDSSIILCNLLDNAIEACRNQKEPAEIVVSIAEVGGYYRILVKNSITESVLSRNAELATTKPESDKHGIGLQTVRMLAEVHEGTLDVYEEDGFFYAGVMLMKPDSV